MKISKNLFYFSSALWLSSALASTTFANEDDPHFWLEGIDDVKALEWVRGANELTDKNLGADPLFNDVYNDALAALNSTDKLPNIEIIGDWVYSLKKSEAHPRGRYLRTSVASFRRNKPTWQTVVDIDALSAKDEVNWVFDDFSCLAPEYQKCLMFLSPGGGDATEMREFNATSLTFVEGGFRLPKAKMNVSWMDANHLFVGTDFGDGSMTESGYPGVIKIWQRGKPLDAAKEIIRVANKSVGTSARRLKSDSITLDLLTDAINYWNRHYYQWDGNKARLLNLPTSAVIIDLMDDELVVSLLDDWKVGKTTYTQGSVVIVDPISLWDESKKVEAHLLRKSAQDSIIEDVSVNKNNILVTVLNDVKSRIYKYQPLAGQWLAERVHLPESGQLQVAASDYETGKFFARYEGFLTPPTLYSVDSALNTKVVQQQSPTFDSSNMTVEQYFVKSLDGTSVPYFVVMNENTIFDGSNPTHIFGYGGFRASLTPSYSGSYEQHNGAYGKAWLERGGVYVVANIRGGAEYGPAWHAAALLENRNKAFEDFEAVAGDLIKRKITSAKHLGIEGRSNGGLLVLAAMNRNPDLYGAIVCGVPLADMQRYNKMLAGASWMAEYGNPDTDDWKFIKEYSPYQNVKEEAGLPPIFFFTSTRDDRVHPGHARKMAAKMKAQGHSVDYFENIEGGHKGSATAEQTARRIALSFTHLWRHLK